MPIIERKCNECQHEDEDIENRQTADTETITCPKCGKITYVRKISPTAFSLNGSGWYKDGYSSKN